MRILFTTDKRSAVSTEINLKNFARLGDVDGVSFEAFRRDYQNFDFILFMGYDPQVAAARAVHPAARIGVVDVRPMVLETARGADFLVSNGPEMTALAARYFSNVFEYPIYPEAERKPIGEAASDRIRIVYHGNRAHAVSMFPYVTRALEELAKEVRLELQLIYNREILSDIPGRYLPRNVDCRIVDWHEGVYEREVAQADIGIAPNLTPLHRRAEAMKMTAPYDDAFGFHETEFLHRFKCTSNPGRILAFAQHGIPVVADLHPSAAQVIRNGENGYLAHDAFSWYQALRSLCVNPQRRLRMGAQMRRTFEERYRIS
ncbi:MAG: glycosyltransferase, partial [Oricola sp.]